ncbi:hypothetical protein BE04_34360 [Sorangium cellulosum]|uniref:Uncharacterized protein n=2 Tax=Sorangium cellulosum TaxID=56 RepID=A0A150Q1C2_SORCE|nr:hypothetical protein [Sorangium cellulosum]AGP38558.1 hypothetical protein SCE1572_31225 [Sorangium cellulosum So0157-2]KYF61805.1 hypothetical protein BE04_34360 [Sorangium cellulosum]
MAFRLAKASADAAAIVGQTMAKYTIYLPPPQAIEAVGMGETSRVAAAALDVLLAHAPEGDLEVLAEQLAPLAVPILERWQAQAAEPDTPGSLSDREAEYDAYFHVHRVSAPDPLEAYCEAVIVAYYRMIRESLKGTSLQPMEIGHLCASIEDILHQFSGRRRPKSWNATPQLAAPPAEAGAPDGALGRWVLGHHAFFVLVQALLMAHRWLSEALANRDVPRAREALAISTQLWWATAASFRFTGDFSNDDYNNIVRPTMAPPFVQDGFSGLFFEEHARLIRTLKSIRPALRALPPKLARSHRLYLWALATAYESHAFVCERFVDQGASLNAAHKRKLASATQTIRGQYKGRALESAGSPSRSKRR